MLPSPDHFFKEQEEKKRLLNILFEIGNRVDSAVYYCDSNTPNRELENTIKEIQSLTCKVTSK